MGLEFEHSNYTAHLGDRLRLSCIGSNLHVNDIVWQVYPISQPLTTTVLYLTGRQVVFSSSNSSKYLIEAEQTSPNTVRTSLTITNLELSDAALAYQCACNIYTACAAGTKASAVANLTLLAPRGAKSDVSSQSTTTL